MLDRFSRPEMAAVWTLENKFQNWLLIETHVAEKQAQMGLIPKEAAQDIAEKGAFSVARIDAIEAEVRHDVIAFLTCVAENVGEHGRFLHQGLTSSDVIDTGFALQLRQAADLLIAGLDRVLAALEKQARAHVETLCIGRSHGIHAEPTTFGLKMASHYAAFARAKQRLIHAREDVSTCALSGAVGTFATVDPAVEAYVAEKLGLKVEPVSTQVVPRDRHAMFFATLGVIAGSIENLATEIRHLQRTEVREAAEFFSPAQKGSSAMPHKRNPILTENLTGLARVIRSYVTPALENITLWHERDISHSSVERVIAPDATIALDFALHRLAGVMEKLIVYPDRMQENMQSLKGLVFSQSVLLALTQGGMAREEAYRIVQAAAMKVWDDGADFETLLRDNSDVMAVLSEQNMTDIFDYNRYARHAGDVIDRTLAA